MFFSCSVSSAHPCGLFFQRKDSSRNYYTSNFSARETWRNCLRTVSSKSLTILSNNEFQRVSPVAALWEGICPRLFATCSRQLQPLMFCIRQGLYTKAFLFELPNPPSKPFGMNVWRYDNEKRDELVPTVFSSLLPFLGKMSICIRKRNAFPTNMLCWDFCDERMHQVQKPTQLEWP